MPNATLAQMGFVDENEQETVYDLEDTQSRSDISDIKGKIPSTASSSNKMATASDITEITNKIPSAASSSNKLVDTTAMNDAIGQAVSAAYKPAGNKTVAELTSSLLVADNRGKVYNMTDAGTTTADFVEGAGHPIRVGDDVGICEPTTGTFKFNLLSGFIAVDTNPTSGSTNPVSSGGVYTALDGKISKSSSAGYVKNDGTIDTDLATTVANKVDKVSGKGLSTNDYTNADKAVVTTAQDNIKANTQLIKDTVGWSGKNKLPNKGVSQTIDGITWVIKADGTVTANGTKTSSEQGLKILDRNTDNYSLPTGDYIFSGDVGANCFMLLQATRNGSLVILGQVNDSNPQVEVSILSTDILQCVLFVNPNKTVSNAVFNPMLRDADILDPTYEPYFGSTAFPRSEQEVLGAKNLLTPFLTSESKTTDNAIFTVNSDGTVDLSTSQVGTGTRTLEKIINLTFAEDVILTGCPKNGGLSNYQLDLNAGAYADTGEGILIPANTNLTKIRIRVASTYNNSNAIKFEPMLRLATDPDDTYVPYAMTNNELTEKVTVDKSLGGTISDTYCNTETSIISIVKQGNVVQLTGTIIVTTEIPSYTPFITDIPKLAAPSDGGQSRAYNFTMFGTGTFYRAYLDGGGKIYPHSVRIPTGTYTIGITYIAEP